MNTYRIYAASLSDYNAGILHGCWIDCDGKDAEEIGDEVQTMLRQSRQPGAEEYAIHDHEGFGDLVGEFTGIDELAAIVAALESADDADALQAFAAHYGYGIEEAAERFEDAYAGQWDSQGDYAAHLVDECGLLESVPESLRYYFDYDAYARDLFMDGMAFVDGYVFNDNH